MRDDHHFRISSFCTTGGCPGVAYTDHGVEVTDVGDETSGSLIFSREQWAAFVAGVKNGEFDLD